MLGLVNIILTLLTKINDGDHNKYHMHDTIPSYLLLAFRFMSLFIFIVGIFMTFRANRKSEPIQDFLIKIGFVGTIYFLSLPVMMLWCTMIEVTDRKWVIFVGQELLKNIMNFWLTWMVSSKKSGYSQINKSSKSFMEHGDKYL